MPISVQNQPRYLAEETNYKYQPVAVTEVNGSIEYAIVDEDGNMLSRTGLPRAAFLPFRPTQALIFNTGGLFDAWIQNSGIRCHPPLVVNSTGRSKWIRKQLLLSQRQTNWKTAEDGYLNPEGTSLDWAQMARLTEVSRGEPSRGRALRATVPWYAFERLHRHVFFVVHECEFETYRRNLAPFPYVHVVGWKFGMNRVDRATRPDAGEGAGESKTEATGEDPPASAAAPSVSEATDTAGLTSLPQLVGFGASRYAAVAFCKIMCKKIEDTFPVAGSGQVKRATDAVSRNDLQVVKDSASSVAACVTTASRDFTKLLVMVRSSVVGTEANPIPEILSEVHDLSEQIDTGCARLSAASDLFDAESKLAAYAAMGKSLLEWYSRTLNQWKNNIEKVIWQSNGDGAIEIWKQLPEMLARLKDELDTNARTLSMARCSIGGMAFENLLIDRNVKPRRMVARVRESLDIPITAPVDRRATVGWRIAWLIDDNVIHLNGHDDLAAIEGKLLEKMPLRRDRLVRTPEPWALCFSPASKVETAMATFGARQAPQPARGTPKADVILQQVVVWNIEKLTVNRINYSPLFVEGAEDLSLTEFLKRPLPDEIPLYESYTVWKLKPDSEKSGLDTLREQLRWHIARLEASIQVNVTLADGSPDSVAATAATGATDLHACIEKTVIPAITATSSAAGDAKSASGPELKKVIDKAICQATERILLEYVKTSPRRDTDFHDARDTYVVDGIAIRVAPK